MPVSAKKYTIHTLLLIANILFISCGNGVKEHLTRENILRLAMQNEIIKQANLSLRSGLNEMIKKGQIKGIYQHPASLDNLYRETDLCLAKIDSAIRNGPHREEDSLFKYYSAFQQAIKQLNSSVEHTPLIEDSSRFKALNEKEFRSKYRSASDSIDIQNEILLLESDVLLNQRYVIEGILKCSLYNLVEDQPVAIAMPEKPVYKKGERLKIMAFLVKLDETLKGTATFGGHEVTAQNGIFEYSRKITERSGTYNVPIEITWQDQYGEKKTYPAKVVFQVK
jgi:hypothetical protein